MNVDLEGDMWKLPPDGWYAARVGEAIEYRLRFAKHPAVRVRFDLLDGEWAGLRIWSIHPVIPSNPYTWVRLVRLLDAAAGPGIEPPTTLDGLCNALTGGRCMVLLEQTTWMRDVEKTSALVKRVRSLA